MKKYLIVLLILFIYIIQINSGIKFNPISLNKNLDFLFNSIENIAGVEYNRTLFFGNKKGSDYSFEAVSFYPENLFYSSNDKKLFIQNRMGLYSFDYTGNKIKPVDMYPNFAKKAEYIITKISKLDFSPNYRYFLGKLQTSNVSSSIILYDMEKNDAKEIIKNVELNPGEPVGYWSNNSKYFIYQNNQKTYYFSITDFERGKLLAEEYRLIGNVDLKNTFWTQDDHLVWIEENYIYKADSRQFYSKSIYKNYLRQGIIIAKIPFKFEPNFDTFKYNDNCKKFVLVKKNSSIFYYSLLKDVVNDPYFQLEDSMRYENCEIFDNGNSIILLSELNKGKIDKKIVLIRKENNSYFFNFFEDQNLKNIKINNFSISHDKNYFCINSLKGAYCFDFETLNLKWKFENEQIIQSINTENDEWILGGIYTTYKYNSNTTVSVPLFASSFNDAGFIGDKIFISCNNKNYTIDKPNKILVEYSQDINSLSKETKNNSSRLISRELNKGFYQEGMYIKDLYSGKLYMITGEPELNYALYQPELKLEEEYYDNPSGVKYEIALVFDCIKTNEGIFPILSTLDRFQIKSTFFINGSFMEVNPELIKQMGFFNNEFGNMFQYYVSLTDDDFLIDKNFIRQGLSANEEKFYKLTGHNFSPIWHSPKYSFNDLIIKYGIESGYNFVTFNLDSLDWVGENNYELNEEMHMDFSGIIQRIIKEIKPGQIIVFSTGINNSIRKDWLFNNLDLLISELVRAGYSFTTVSDLLKKYRDK